MDDFEKELKAGFLQEAEQALADVEQCFLSLESNPSDVDNLNKIFRLAHNLKGSSKAVGFNEMGQLTHEFETFILKIKNGELAASPAVVSFLLKCNDFLRQMVSGLNEDLARSFEIQPLIAEMEILSAGGGEAPAEAMPDEMSMEPVPTAEEPAPETMALEPNTELLAELHGNMTPGEEPPAPSQSPPLSLVPNESGASAAAPEPSREPKEKAGAKAAATEESIRVSLLKVEKLLNAVGEMVIMQTVLNEQALESTSSGLRRSVQQLAKIGKEIQDLSMSLRMIPIKPTFQKMQRIVRDTSQALNKDVGITLAGEDTEIDKTVLEKINDPLVHLVRNSVDHGIESTEVRLERGKPEKGAVRLAAFHEGGRFVIEVSDDGGGLDPEKLTRKAIDKGLLKPGTHLAPADAYNLIFLPGFSTKEQVTDVSGRGVGMDVVKTNIQALGGEIQILSEKGKGSTFRILLPLTLAIIDGLTVTVSGQKFVIPLAHVHETLRPEPGQIQKTTNVGDILMLRGENLALYRLSDFFGMKSAKPIEELIAFVVRSGDRPFALMVDDILGQSQVVVKRLGPEFVHYRGVGGSTILGDGRPAFIIEPPDLFKRSARPSASSSTPRAGVA